MKKSLNRYIDFLLLTFVFSLPFEYWDPFNISLFTITKLLGLLYFMLSFFNGRECFSLQRVKKVVLMLFMLWMLLVVTSNINYTGNNVTVFHLTFFQNIILFWLISNRVSHYPKLMPKLFTSLVLGVFTMGILLSLGIGVDSNSNYGSSRLTFFGNNPNRIGDLAAITVFLTFHMLTNMSKYYGKATLLFVLTFPISINILMLSGSRGALLVALVGVITLFFFQKGGIKRKIILSIIGLTFISFIYNKTLESEIMSRRIESTLEDNSIGERAIIWQHSLDIFLDNPLLGIGNTGYENEITRRHGTYVDTHNLFLFFLVSGGIVALVLFMCFIFIIFRQAWKYFFIKNDILTLSVFAIYLFLISKSGGAINIKLHWTLIAIIYGLGLSLRPSSKKQYYFIIDKH